MFTDCMNLGKATMSKEGGTYNPADPADYKIASTGKFISKS